MDDSSQKRKVIKERTLDRPNARYISHGPRVISMSARTSFSNSTTPRLCRLQTLVALSSVSFWTRFAPLGAYGTAVISIISPALQYFEMAKLTL